MNAGDRMRHVVVAGGGIVAWSAAAALRRHLPSLEVTVLSCPVPPEALADRMVSTLPSISGFHHDLGLRETDTLLGARSGLRIGTLFEGWSAGLAPYVHAYGSHGATVEGIPFHQLWLRAHAQRPVPPFDQFSAAAELGRLGRVGGAAATTPSGEIGYGLRLSLERYHALMRDFALHLGAREQPCDSFEPKLRAGDGFIEALVLEGGASLGADLFIDCSGPSAPLRSALDRGFEDWSAFLPCDRLVLASSEPGNRPAMLDRVSAAATGWQWESASPTASSRGAAFSSAHAGDGDVEALGAIMPEGIEIAIRQGCWTSPWLRNCVAIGDAAVMVEPLEWANLHLAHSQIDRLISMMPGRDCASIELAEYNRQCSDEARRVRDFLCMHYVTARRDEPFWKDAAAIDPPPSLAHTLSLFAERGRLPYYEEETFSRDSWTAVLLGQGFEPRRTDPLADMLSIDRIEGELDRHAGFIRSYVAAQPMYLDYMSNFQ